MLRSLLSVRSAVPMTTSSLWTASASRARSWFSTTVADVETPAAVPVEAVPVEAVPVEAVPVEAVPAPDVAAEVVNAETASEATTTTPTHVSGSTTSAAFVRLDGVPLYSLSSDVRRFLDGIDVSESNIYRHFDRFWRVSSTVYVKLDSRSDVEAALKLRRKPIGLRWINVAEVSQKEFDERVDAFLQHNKNFSVLLSGLPYSIRASAIRDFFRGYDMDDRAIKILRDPDTQDQLGKAIVRFRTEREAFRALREKNREFLGDRFVQMHLIR